MLSTEETTECFGRIWKNLEKATVCESNVERVVNLDNEEGTSRRQETILQGENLYGRKKVGRKVAGNLQREPIHRMGWAPKVKAQSP
jgi:hypothetical protein